VDQRLAGRLVLLVIDEAQNLGLAALEELRMLSNLETEKSKLLQIVLVGQPNLRDKLGAPELEQLRQRITVSYHLDPLDSGETSSYINHRLRLAALGAPLEFPPDVTDLIHARSRGVPRIINVICDATLVFGYAEERRQIDMSLMDEVLAELEATGVLLSASRPPVGEAAQVPATASVSAPVPATLSASAPVAVRAVPQAASPVLQPPPQPQASQSRPPSSQTLHSAPSQLADRLASRTAELEQREQAVRQRERELAEQRRILAEEYRLLRTRPAPPAVATHAPARFTPVTSEGFWSRIKRMVVATD
jgi:hypothetical protein